VYAPDEIADVRAAHPLHAVVPLLRKMLVAIADASQHIMIVTDMHGTILWREGAVGVCLRADPVGLCEGTRWSEDAIGTNAMGTALAVDAPVQIYSAEHLVRTYHTWSCAAAPVHDPDTGRQIGAIDVSGYLQSFHPAVISLVAATAELAESHLRMQMAVRDERLLAKNMGHLAGLRGEAGALLTPTGRGAGRQTRRDVAGPGGGPDGDRHRAAGRRARSAAGAVAGRLSAAAAAGTGGQRAPPGPGAVVPAGATGSRARRP